MQEQEKLFTDILAALHQAELLKHFILIGSWCQPIYAHYFSNPPELPVLRTTDIDFLIPSRKTIPVQTNVPLLLSRLGFEIQFSALGGYSKFVHPDLELDFLTPEIGRPNSTPYTVKNLNITAQRLRFLSILQDNTLTVDYNSFPVTVPQPAAFVLHKLLISERRNNSAKKIKDRQTASQIGEYLLTQPKQQQLLVLIFSSFKPKWKKTVLNICKTVSESLFSFLNKVPITHSRG